MGQGPKKKAKKHFLFFLEEMQDAEKEYVNVTKESKEGTKERRDEELLYNFNIKDIYI